MKNDTIEAISIEDWGKDHWSLLAFIETQNVDNPNEFTDLRRMRVNSKKRWFGNGSELNWDDAWGTRDKENKIPYPSHDDLDVAEELIENGFCENRFTMTNPILVLTKRGREVSNLIREHKAYGGSFANFKI